MRKMLGYGLVLLAIMIGGALAWLYTPDKRRAALEKEYADPPSVFLDVAGIRLHVRDTGPRAAPSIVLLHGFGSSLHTWEDWARDLERDHRVIRYDIPGFGLTGADPSRDYTDGRSVAVLVALMDRLGVTRASIIGNSMGGRIAWTFASLNPERTEKLVLIAPDGFASSGREYGATPKVSLMIRMLPYVLPSFMLRASLAPAYANADGMTDALFRRYRDMMLAPGVRGAIVDRMSQQVLVDPVPLLQRIEVPTLLMWGEKDGVIPFANSADYLQALPHATLAACAISRRRKRRIPSGFYGNSWIGRRFQHHVSDIHNGQGPIFLPGAGPRVRPCKSSGRAASLDHVIERAQSGSRRVDQHRHVAGRMPIGAHQFVRMRNWSREILRSCMGSMRRSSTNWFAAEACLRWAKCEPWMRFWRIQT